MHVTLRSTVLGRQRPAYHAIRKVMEHYYGRDDFRIVHVSIQESHLHMIVEAANREALTRGMQSFTIRAARALNAATPAHDWSKTGTRTGAVFPSRYHAVQIVTARQARSTLAYVLNNWRKHRHDVANLRMTTFLVDGYASGLSFDGWAEPVPQWSLPDGYVLLPVSPPRTSLLRTDWRRYGRISVGEVPGPLQ